MINSVSLPAIPPQKGDTMPTKEPYDVVMRPAIREAVRRGSEKFHVPESVFILHALEYYLKFRCSQHPFSDRIEFFEGKQVSAAKNRAEKARAKILGLLTPNQKKNKREQALEKAKRWLEQNETQETQNGNQEGSNIAEDSATAERPDR
jgi:hypothetical protein